MDNSNKDAFVKAILRILELIKGPNGKFYDKNLCKNPYFMCSNIDFIRLNEFYQSRNSLLSIKYRL